MDILSFDKLLFHADKIEKIRRDEVQFPVHATISLGNYCNHRCLWCTAYEYQQDKAKQMDFASLMNWLELARERGLAAVGYVGNGEPTAYKEFGELVTRVNALGMQQGMFTNGLLLDRYFDEVLEAFTYLRISLDGGSPEVHSKMHDVPDTHYPRIMSNLAEIIKRRSSKNSPTIGVQFATHHRNICDLYAAAEQSADIGVDYFSVKPVFNRGSVGERIDKNSLTTDEITPIVNKMRADLESKSFKIYYRPFQVESEEANRNTLEYDRCVAGFFNLNVYEDGKLVYCGPNRIPVGTVEDDLDVIEEKILKLSTKLNLKKCPAGCRYHAMNHLVGQVLHPERAADYHINFL